MMERWCFVGTIIISDSNKRVAVAMIEVDHFCSKAKADEQALIWKQMNTVPGALAGAVVLKKS